MQTTLRNALPILAAAYAERFGTEIIIGGSSAMTDGRTIWLPLIDDPALKDVLVGFLAHESAHCKLSRFDLFQKLATPLEKRICNILEDCRIEKAFINDYPGMEVTLRSVLFYLDAIGHLCTVSSHDNQAMQLTGYLLYRCRYQQWGLPLLAQKMLDSETVLRSAMPTGFFVRLEALMDRYFDTMSSTLDAVALTRAILKAVADAEQEEAERPTQPSGEAENASVGSDDNPNDSDGCEGTSTGSDVDAKGDTDASPDLPDAGERSHCGVDCDSSMSTEDADPVGGTGSTSDSSLLATMLATDDVGSDLTEALANALEAQAAADTEAFSFEEDVGMRCPRSGDRALMREGILTSARIRGRLSAILDAQTRQQKWLSRSGQRIDSRKLHRVRTGQANVFVRRTERDIPDTAVHLLVDRSGSMGDTIHVANQAAVALALAVSSVPRCDVAVSVFPGIGGSVSPAITRGQPVRPNLDLLPPYAAGTTPMAKAMLYALRELANANRSRKVLIVVTDGEPDNRSSVTYLNDLSRNEVATYGIGINSDAVTSLFDQAVVIDDVSALSDALFRIAQGFLEAA